MNSVNWSKTWEHAWHKLAMSSSAKRSWKKLHKNETGMLLLRAAPLERNGLGISGWKIMVCLFCHREGRHRHEFGTLGADETLRQMAREQQETV